MELLDPTKIRKNKEIDLLQTVERINKLGLEESRLVKSISNLKIEENKKKDYIKLINQNYEKAKEKIVFNKNKLSREVKILEARKKEAKKPVDEKLDEIKNQFTKILENDDGAEMD